MAVLRASGSPEGPQVLWDAWQAGKLSVADLRGVIPQIWAYTDWPECVIGADRWTSLFREAGLLVVPTYLPQPTVPLTLYRGATEVRSRGMAWSLEKSKAQEFQERYTKLGKTAHVYTVTVEPADVLAVFELRGEHEVIVNTAALNDPERCA